MADSLFLDPFAQPPAGDDGAADSASADRDAPGAGVVVERDGPSRPVTADVPLEEDQAVEAFLEYPHLWWPAEMRACGEDSHVGLEDGLLVEEGADGRRHSWARIGAVDADGLHLRWVGRQGRTGAGPVCEVVVGFGAAPADRPGTTVMATVAGPSASREEWVVVMDAFSRFAGGRLREA